MTDHVISLTVILDKDYDADAAEIIAAAIQMIKGVKHVELGEMAEPDIWFAVEEAKDELRRKLREVLK